MNTIFIDKIGRGTPTIIINGGPGMSYTYIKQSLLQLTKALELIFFDQPGCGKSNDDCISIDNTIKSFSNLANQISEDCEYNLIVHSWGTFILGSVLKNKLLKRLPRKIILINPAPFDKNQTDFVTQKLFERIPQNELSLIVELSNQGGAKAGKELMKIALPYYSGSNNTPNIEILYNIDTYNKISSEISDYDFTSEAVSILDRSVFVFGDQDYIQPDDFSALFNGTFNKIEVISGGHFSFAQDEKIFCEIVKKHFN